ncbi:MAG: ABC transporter permease [Xanthobacteraceae bacterium]
MPFIPVILWTDALIYVLVGCIILAGLYVRRQEYLLVVWRKVLQSRPSMAALTVLLVFVTIGLLDSLHYRPRQAPNEIWSALDALFTRLKSDSEKTYSAPFATHLFTTQTVENADGTREAIYPRLKFGGAHLADPAERSRDVLVRSVLGVVLALAGWLVVSAALVAWMARTARIAFKEAARRIASDETEVAWKAILLAAGAVALLAVPLLMLSSYYHVFGTDKVGNDVFFLTLKSIRTGLVIGTLTTLTMLPFAAGLGILAGYLGGLVDDVIQYIYATLNSIPGVLLIAAAVLMLRVVIDSHPQWFATSVERADARLLALCLILGVTSWTGLCRLLRAESLKLRELEYVQAARAFGVSDLRIMLQHILPNVMHIVLISLVMDFSGLVLAEAVLSYVGIGVDPTTTSFGTMINTARLELAREPVVWWSLAAAFAFMFALVLSANLFSDAVRDALDPHTRSRAVKLAAARAGP